MSLLSPLRPSISACFIALASMSLLGFTSCEKVGGIGAKLEEALNRKPTSTESGVPQPDPEQLLADEPDTVIPPPPEPVKMEPEINKDARVSILGYHDFTEGKSRNDMIINIDDFRAEMQAIKDAEIPVISMREFLAWKRGEEEIPDPCIMIESMMLLYTLKGEVPVDEYSIPLGVAKVVREGTDVTLISYGWMLNQALAAAEELAKEGISAEVVDLRSLMPIDYHRVLESVKKELRESR